MKTTNIMTKETGKLLDAAVAIETESAIESGNLGFFARSLTQWGPFRKRIAEYVKPLATAVAA